MRIVLHIGLLLLFCISCNNDNKFNPNPVEGGMDTEIQFDKSKWRLKEGLDYPYRDQMVRDLIYNDTVRKLNEQEILNLLGEPTRSTDGHLYYMITQKRLGTWPLHTKSLVIKFSNDSTINWIKIHE